MEEDLPGSPRRGTGYFGESNLFPLLIGTGPMASADGLQGQKRLLAGAGKEFALRVLSTQFSDALIMLP